MESALAFWPVIFVCFLICPWSVITTPFKKTMTVQGTGDSFDWRNKGVISNVSDQGMMGDPMDYVITEGVESLLAIQTGHPVIELSIDEVGECCDDEGHQPKYQGFDCIVLIGGLCKVNDYNSTEGICNNATCQAVGKVTRTGYLPANREDVMLQVIHQVPLSALIDAELTSFQTYTTGIYDDPNCSSVDLDHVVQIVGYGTSSDVDYWIIKNSWGVDWGEHGYMRIARGKNRCGIASNVFYPINDKPVYPINDKPVYPINDQPVYPINDKPVYPINDKPACYP